MKKMKDDAGEIFSPVMAKRTFEEVSGKIKEMIFDGVLKPGSRLPSENELAKKLQVGRQSIREALRLLELTGFISIRRGANGGPVIEDTMFAKIGGMYLDAFRFNRISIMDLTRARIEIEKSIINFVFENISEQDIKDLKANILAARNRQKKNLLAFEENLEFHRLLARASKNHVFIIVSESLLAMLSHFRSRLNNVGIERSESVTRYHEEILTSIINGQRDLAFELLEKHLMEVHLICTGENKNDNPSVW
jgi:DNA-binding FadR family transcriptional regulator